MQRERPNRTDVMRACVWPTVVALIVTAVILIERLQVDWTAACSLQAEKPNSCDQENFNMVFAWVPAAFAFGLAHIVGAAGLYGDSNTRPAMLERLGKFAAYFAIHIFPVFGWYFFYVGLAAGFLISLTVVGLDCRLSIRSVCCWLCCGIAFGACCRTILYVARSRWMEAASRLLWRWIWSWRTRPHRRARICLIRRSDYLAGPDRPWLTAAGALSAVALSCIVLWVAALKANFPSIRVLRHPGFTSAVATIGAVAAALILPVHLMVANGATVFPPNGGLFAPVANYFRGNKPPIAAH